MLLLYLWPVDWADAWRELRWRTRQYIAYTQRAKVFPSDIQSKSKLLYAVDRPRIVIALPTKNWTLELSFIVSENGPIQSRDCAPEAELHHLKIPRRSCKPQSGPRLKLMWTRRASGRFLACPGEILVYSYPFFLAVCRTVKCETFPWIRLNAFFRSKFSFTSSTPGRFKILQQSFKFKLVRS